MTYRLTPAWKAFTQLFLTEQYFACHEVLEDLWMKADGDEKIYLQALIQLCVGLYHWQNNNPNGAQSLLKKAHKKADYLCSAGHPVSMLRQLCTQTLKHFECLSYTKETTRQAQLPFDHLNFLNEGFNQKPS